MANKSNPILEDIARIKRELTELKKMRIHVGILGSADSEILKIAYVHEKGMTIEMTDKMRRYLGAIGLFDDAKKDKRNNNKEKQKRYVNIPQRSFINASYESGKQELEEIVKSAVDKVVSGELTARAAAEQVGTRAAQFTQNYINEGKVTPEKGEFAKKRSTQHTTLFDSGRLVGSISYEIEEVG